jgi:hypothetical protein
VAHGGAWSGIMVGVFAPHGDTHWFQLRRLAFNKQDGTLDSFWIHHVVGFSSPLPYHSAVPIPETPDTKVITL